LQLRNGASFNMYALAHRNSYALYRMVLFPATLNDNYYKPLPFSTFWIAIHIVVMGGDRNVNIST